MNNYCCAFSAYLKAPPHPFTIFKLPTSLSLCTILFIHCQSHHHLHSALLLAPHRPNFKFAPSAQPQFFILHYSFFIIHSHSSPPTPPSPPLFTIPRPAPPQFKIHRQRRSPQLFIIHFSSFIIHYLRHQPRHSHHHRRPRTIPRPALHLGSPRKRGAVTAGIYFFVRHTV